MRASRPAGRDRRLGAGEAGAGRTLGMRRGYAALGAPHGREALARGARVLARAIGLVPSPGERAASCAAELRPRPLPWHDWACVREARPRCRIRCSTSSAQIIAWLLIAMGAFFLARAVVGKRERGAMKELLGVRVDKVKGFRDFIIQRLDAVAGFFFVLAGVGHPPLRAGARGAGTSRINDPREALGDILAWLGGRAGGGRGDRGADPLGDGLVQPADLPREPGLPRRALPLPHRGRPGPPAPDRRHARDPRARRTTRSSPTRGASSRRSTSTACARA